METAWRLAGTYFESCNCDAVCPCRRIDGVPGGRSTNGVCLGVLSWLIEEGAVAGRSLDGLAVAIAFGYDDDEPGSPWTFVLYLDEGADDEQRRALADVFLGRLGGDALAHFPWAWKPSARVDVLAAQIELDHTPRRQWLRIRDRVDVRISGRWDGDAAVTCVIPGHNRSGEELVADHLLVDESELSFEYRGSCGYAASFDYRSG